MGSSTDFARSRRKPTKKPVKNPASTAAKAPPKRKRSKTTPPKKPWKMLLLGFFALVGLVYLLNHLLTVEDGGQTTVLQPKPVQKNVQPKPTQVKPIQPKPAQPKVRAKQPSAQQPSTKPASSPEKAKVATNKTTAKQTTDGTGPKPNKFEFYELLPKSEVNPDAVEAYKSTPRDAKSDKIYMLQAGSFRSPEDAEKMRATLLLAGLPNVHTDKSDGSNGTWHRVRIGPFDNRSLLNKAQDKLARMRINAIKVRVK